MPHEELQRAPSVQILWKFCVIFQTVDKIEFEKQ